MGSGEFVIGREDCGLASVESRSEWTVENGEWRVRSQSGDFRLESEDWMEWKVGSGK